MASPVLLMDDQCSWTTINPFSRCKKMELGKGKSSINSFANTFPNHQSKVKSETKVVHNFSPSSSQGSNLGILDVIDKIWCGKSREWLLRNPVYCIGLQVGKKQSAAESILGWFFHLLLPHVHTSCLQKLVANQKVSLLPVLVLLFLLLPLVFCCVHQP